MDAISYLSTNWREVVLILDLLGILAFIALLFLMSAMHFDIERNIRTIPRKVRDMSGGLQSVTIGLSKENQDIGGREKEQVIDEAKKISQLWKSRREQLQMGYWEKMEARADELTLLQNEKDHLEELVKRTKIKYHKRELDEESFREIVKDYQKQLMEINVKIWELEKSLG